MKVFLVMKGYFTGVPVAIFSDEGAARRFVLRQPGKFNALSIEEFTLDAEPTL